MKNIRKTLAYMCLTSALLIAPAFAKDALEKRVHNENNQITIKTKYDIKCSAFHVGDGYYILAEDDQEYEIKMEAESTGFFKFLGLKYIFSTQGYKEDGELYPKHLNRINKDKKSKKIEVTDTYFDYENLEAKSYAYRYIDGKIDVKWDTMNNPEKITKNVKDFLTFMEELRREEPRNYYNLKTIARGKVHSFEIKKRGEEVIKLNDEHYATIVYETAVDKDLFGIDSKVKIWVHKEADHTILKVWIENGPLWTSIDLEYSGRKAELE